MDISNIAVLSIALVFIGWFTALIMSLRRVVSPDRVHIVQYRGKTVSYGSKTGHGNVYYEWPSYLPIIGVSKVELPVSNFTLLIRNFEAYDLGRVPFVIDLQAAFRIHDTNLAASRVASYDHLVSQLEAMVRGAARTILASSDIEEIMQGRSKFGNEFTKELESSLQEWGVITFRNIELMDIRDGNNSEVINNIQAKKQSMIEMQSRKEVANNKRDASIAEVQAIRETDIKKTEAEQSVALRINEKNQAVGVSQEQAKQAVHEQSRITKEKEMAVIAVHDVQRAEINKKMGIVSAQEQKERDVLAADAKLIEKEREAAGISAVGNASAEAEKAMQLAQVSAQVELAEKISGIDGYKEYLIAIEQIKANADVGKAQALTLQNADVKLIANGGNTQETLSNLSGILSPKGGLNVGAALEAFGNTDIGQEILSRFTGGKE